MPTTLRDFRLQGQSGKHVLAGAFPGLATPSCIAFDAGFNPYQRACLNR